MDFAMPYMINTISDQTRKVFPRDPRSDVVQISVLEAWVEEEKKKAQAQQQVEDETPIIGGGQRLIGYGGMNGFVS